MLLGHEELPLMNFLGYLRGLQDNFIVSFGKSYSAKCLFSKVMIAILELDHNAIKISD